MLIKEFLSVNLHKGRHREKVCIVRKTFPESLDISVLLCCICIYVFEDLWRI